MLQIVNNNANSNQAENNNVQTSVVSQGTQVGVAATNTVDGKGTATATKLSIKDGKKEDGAGADPVDPAASLTNALNQDATVAIGQVGGDQTQAAAIVNNFPTPSPTPPECTTGRRRGQRRVRAPTSTPLLRSTPCCVWLTPRRRC